MKRIFPITLVILAIACQAQTAENSRQDSLPKASSADSNKAGKHAGEIQSEPTADLTGSPGTSSPGESGNAAPIESSGHQERIDSGLNEANAPSPQLEAQGSKEALAHASASSGTEHPAPSASTVSDGNAQVRWQAELQAFLEAHVRRGGVDYIAAARDPGLAAVREGIAKAKPESMSAAARKAFYINAYNVLVIAAVCDRLPVSSVMDIPDFFHGIKHPVGGQQLSLDELEKGTLYREFPDPRLHFALVCGAVGCPPLRPLAYSAEGLEAALDETTRQACNDPRFMRIDEEVAGVSQIFVWYLDDFGGTSAAARSFINQYRKEPIPAKAKWSPYPYDWLLNQVLEK